MNVMLPVYGWPGNLERTKIYPERLQEPTALELEGRHEPTKNLSVREATA
ncbi:hypothetical protein LDO26_15390 [Luteimonas sp. BDR2-5]|nr:hypothetical protein [Luteimonas sp. BDR2-5]MCD9029577.1 hypothetical protein [Luteimonas sp. BDR2-5]